MQMACLWRELPFHEDLTLDVYGPRNWRARDDWPVVVFLHSGAWSIGDPSTSAVMLKTWARCGYVIVAPRYRLSGVARFEVRRFAGPHLLCCLILALCTRKRKRERSPWVFLACLVLVAWVRCELVQQFVHRMERRGQHRDDRRLLPMELASRNARVGALRERRLQEGFHFPAHLWDCARAVRWVTRHKRKLRADTENKLIIAGHSAGAHLAAMLIAHPRFLRGVGVAAPGAVRALILISGPYSAARISRFALPDMLCSAVFGRSREHWHNCFPLDAARRASPERWPPTLVLGAEFDYSLQAHLWLMRYALERRGVDVESHVYTGLTHCSIVTHWRDRHRFVLDDVLAFLDARLSS